MKVDFVVLVFGDDRRWRGGVELVADPDLDAVQVGLAAGDYAERGQARKGEGVVGGEAGMAELGVPIFGPNRPVVGDGVFKTAATVQPTRVVEELTWPPNGP